MIKVIYTANATARGGRNGYVETDDNSLVLELQGLDMPKKESGATTNPEQLFACAYASCFGSALEVVAGKEKIDVSKATVTAHISLVKDASWG